MPMRGILEPRLLGQSPESPAILLVRRFESLPELSRMGFVSHWCNDEYLAVGGYVQRRIGTDLQQIKDRSIDNKGQAIAVFRQFLNHIHTPI